MGEYGLNERSSMSCHVIIHCKDGKAESLVVPDVEELSLMYPMVIKTFRLLFPADNVSDVDLIEVDNGPCELCKNRNCAYVAVLSLLHTMTSQFPPIDLSIKLTFRNFGKGYVNF